jgi:hypothetical protein
MKRGLTPKENCMKKLLWITALFALCAAGFVAAQEGAGASAGTMLNVGNYSKLFLNGGGRPDSKYFRAVTDEDWERVASLGGKDLENIDTPLEISLLSYAAGVIDVRPIEADRILPASNPKLSGLKLGSAVLKELAEIKFLDPSNTAAIGRYEGMIKFISDKNGVSRAEIENYYRQGIGALIAATVVEEFNKVKFMIDRNYNAVLMYNPQNGQYELSYEDANNIVKKLTVASLQALSSEMSKSGDFSTTAFNTVRDNAALIPATIFDGWKKTTSNMVNPYNLLTNALVNFYLDSNGRTPAGKNYDVLLGIYARTMLAAITNGDAFTNNMLESIARTMISFNQALHDKIGNDLYTLKDMIAAAEIPSGAQYGIFTLTKATGDEIFVSKKRQAPGLVQ